MTSRSARTLKGLLLLASASVLAIPATPLHAQVNTQVAPSETHAKGDISGDWQGTIEAGKSLRVVLRITKADKGFAAKFYSIDQGAQPFSVTSVTLDGSAVKLTIDMVGGTFAGTVTSDGNSMVGTWTQGQNPLPLTLIRATRETAWEIPAPAPPPQMMPADADPSFEVATIKPNDSGATSLQGIGFGGHKFMTQAGSLVDLICFAYQVQKKQIVGLPDWADKDRYDISAVPDTLGNPNPVQFRSMLKKLLADRFKLTSHKDQRELSAFVLMEAKGGSKLKLTELSGPGPGFGFRPQPGGLLIPVRNANMEDLAGFLQSLVVDRPVVDRTGLKGRFDFTLTFTPDDSMFNGHPPPLPAKTDTTESAPSLFEAMQQQLGLKLDAQKTQVPVIAIDHVDKPTAN